MDKISFWTLLKNYKIVIPIIQRDYAQGRSGKEYIREKFLTQIKNALDGSNPSGELDFVYGTTKDGCFYPLDGQQRLTTLWLLHWFIASKAGKLKEAKETLKKFSYETRTSSREFCEKLCEFDISNFPRVADAIQKQTWFYVAWKQDPTIQSMLRMLEGTDRKNKRGNDFIDGIEEAFQCYDHDHLECRLPLCRYIDYWNQLAGSACPVKFSKLEINSAELPVSDDLYIKMNARGKPLSDFENFKADLISSLSEGDAVTYGSLIDNNWTNFFWNKDEIDLFDSKWIAFLCRFAVCVKIENSTSDTNENIAAILKDWCVYKDDPEKGFIYKYKVFRDFQNIFNGTVLARVEKIFCGWQALKKSNDFSLTSSWGDSFDFIPVKKENSISTLTMKTRVLFYGTMLFCEKCGADEKDTCLIDEWSAWKRVIWNLAENTNESSNLDSFVGVMKMIGKLAEGCLDVYAYLENNADVLMNNFKFDQLKEEIDKAKQINSLSSPDKETIIRAEKYAFFNGAIRFLYRNENGEEKWDGFAKKFENAQKYFDSNGVAEKYCENAILLRNFLAKAKEIDFWFGNGEAFWRNKVLLDEKYKNIVSDILTNNINENLGKITGKKWIIDETLVADAIKHDGNAYGQWCILYDWRSNCPETLTRYAVRVSGHINHPERVIPLNMKRNNLLGEFPSIQKRGSCYFIGWETDIKFEYKGNEFIWHEGIPCQVYLKEKNFNVEVEETKESFKGKLDDLINEIQN